MDEIAFRFGKLLESLQITLTTKTTAIYDGTKALGERALENSKQGVTFVLENPRILAAHAHLVGVYSTTKQITQHVTRKIGDGLSHPREGVVFVGEFLKDRREYIYVFTVGVVVGVCIGYTWSYLIYRDAGMTPRMKAVICTTSGRGVEGITYSEDVPLPAQLAVDDVLIQVKAASIDVVDVDISQGYGAFIRSHVLPYINKQTHPLILGRSCAGIVTDIGENVHHVDVGDEIWTYASTWTQGTLCEYTCVKEYRVAKKPPALGFEGAASLPYCACLALKLLHHAKLSAKSACGKRVLIVGCHTPVGCVLTQILHVWRAHCVTTSSVRAAPIASALGVRDNIVLVPEPHVEPMDIKSNLSHQLIKDLRARGERFDYVFLSDDFLDMNARDLNEFTTSPVIVTKHAKLVTDRCGVILRALVSSWLRARLFMQRYVYGRVTMYDDFDVSTLNHVYNLVEKSQLQVIVDHIYSPHDVDLAVAHRLSYDSVGSTILKFTS